jgi:allantoin racemase
MRDAQSLKGHKMDKLIRVISPTVESEALAGMVDFIKAQSIPGFVIEHQYLGDGPGSVSSFIESGWATPPLVSLCRQAEQEGAAGIFLNCMCDPGLHAVREAVTIPVIAPAIAAMHQAALLGQRFAFLDVIDTSRAMVIDQVRRYGLESSLASFRAVNVPVLELEAKHDLVVDRLFEGAKRAILEDYADSIILGCGTLYSCAGPLAARLDSEGLLVPILNPIPWATRLLAATIDSGLTHSKRAYPTPPCVI